MTNAYRITDSEQELRNLKALKNDLMNCIRFPYYVFPKEEFIRYLGEDEYKRWLRKGIEIIEENIDSLQGDVSFERKRMENSLKAVMDAQELFDNHYESKRKG